MKNRTVLRINLREQKGTYLKIPEIHNYIGGEPVAIFLLSKFKKNENIDEPYVSFTSGPFNGLFPYASKGVFLESIGKEYTINIGGGKLPSLMNFANIDTIEIIGKAKKPVYVVINNKDIKIIEVNKDTKLESFGISGKRSQIIYTNENILVDNYFKYSIQSRAFTKNNLKGISFSPITNKPIGDKEQYLELYKKLLDRQKELTVSSGSNPSCFGCPMGCAFSSNIEDINVSILPRALVSCGFAENIYNDINTVFACFQVLKYDYNHDFLEAFAFKMGEFFKDFKNYLNS